MNKKAAVNIVSALAAVFLAFTYIGVGFGVCSGSPEPTRIAANATIDDSGSPFTKEQLVAGAVATQDYSFNTHNLDHYMAVISEMNEEGRTPYEQYDKDQIQGAPEQFAITPEQISHLDDVNEVADRFVYPILIAAVMAGFLLVAGFNYVGRDVPVRALLWSGIGTLALIAVLVIWALASFDSLFAVFHSLFFADGTWTFPADSLLITMLPEDFWVLIGGIWIGITALLSIASIMIAVIARRRLQASSD